MLRKDVVFKALDDEMPDYVPIYEGTIDNLKICSFYRTKYQFQLCPSLLFFHKLKRFHTRKVNIVKKFRDITTGIFLFRV